jgi:hypothetical protein
MKRNTLLITLIVTVSAISLAPAQTINWSAIQNHQKHFINVNAAWDYAATIGLGYGYKLKTKMPSMLAAHISIPAGEDLTDDFKTKIGYQARLFQAGNLQASVIASGIFRQFHSNLVTLQNLGLIRLLSPALKAATPMTIINPDGMVGMFQLAVTFNTDCRQGILPRISMCT